MAVFVAVLGAVIHKHNFDFRYNYRCLIGNHLLRVLFFSLK